MAQQKYNWNYETVRDLQALHAHLQNTNDKVTGALYGNGHVGGNIPQGADIPTPLINQIRVMRDALSEFLHDIGEE